MEGQGVEREGARGVEREHVMLICSVGGSPEPVVASICEFRPAAVRFVVSKQTKRTVDDVLSVCAQRGVPIGPGCYECLDVDDGEDLGKGVEALRSLNKVVRDWVSREGDYGVVVDFTGGTKCMSAALALVARRWPCRFSYVGGERRSKGGLGVVETGSERVRRFLNPWDALGYQGVEDAVTVFNKGGYGAAVALLNQTIPSVGDEGRKRELVTICHVLEAYAAWDRFDLKESQRAFNLALRNSNDLMQAFPNGRNLVERLKRHLAQVESLLKKEPKDRSWVEDLVRNAKRRAAEGRYDDAVARLYRAVEALAQVRLRERHGITETKEVPMSCVPEPLRARWAPRARNDVITLGLSDQYQLLEALNDELGRRFARSPMGRKGKSPLSTRNGSILAHGFEPVGEKAYQSMLKGLNALEPFEDSEDDDWSLPLPG